MNKVWQDKFNRLLALLKEQLTETSTLRGILVLATLGTGWAKNLPVDSYLPLAVAVGAVLKVLLPDRIGQ